VIVPDGAMSGLPLAALESSPPRLRLVEQAILSVAGSTSLHLYARARDAEIANDAHPAVLLIGDPAVDPRLHATLGVGQLPYARAEARALHEHEYGSRSILLLGEEATVPALRRHMSEAAVLHFGGHAVANPRLPHLSSLLLAPSEDHSGQWTAEEILRDLPALDRTRLVILGACSTAGGMPVGPLGLAPLVRPFVASGVPAVVGSLWDVGDATTQPLLVSFHRHYRHGDDVAVALRKAQLSMLRSKGTARNEPWAWAPFQVIGQARSPFGSRAANEETDDERISASHSFQRPDGHHPE
jgi:CHAT domain-containing protein